MNLVVQAGDIIVTNFKGYQHWSIVSDQSDSWGIPMLISATRRNETVQEEPWEDVTQGKESYVADVKVRRPIQEVMDLARSKINKWDYSVTSNNCEHFVKWATGHDVTSLQVKASVSATLVGGALAVKFLKEPTPAKVLGVAAASGLAALYLSRAKKKNEYG